MADNYGLTPEILMQYLLPMLSGDSKGDKAALDIQGKGTNNYQNIMQLIFDPRFAVMSGTYDPMQLVQDQPVSQPWQDELPLTMQYMNSGDPVIAEVASGLLSGQYDPLSARTVLSESPNASSLDPIGLAKVVDDISREIADNATNKSKYERDEANRIGSLPKQKDVFTEAGLPSLLEQYTADTIPLPEGRSQYADTARQALVGAQAKLDNYRSSQTAAPASQGPTRQVPTFSPEEMAIKKFMNDQLGGAFGGAGSFGDDLTRPFTEDGILGGLNSAGEAKAKSIENPMRDVYAGSADRGSKGRGAAPAKKGPPDMALINLKMNLSTKRSQSQAADGYAQGYAGAASKSGRSPLVDALVKRLMARPT